MGVENNECVIATTWNEDCIADFHKWLGTDILPAWRSLFVVVDSMVNVKTTIFLAPDGSKKGWSTSNEGEMVRNQFIRFLQSKDYEDGSSPFDWVEVGYGEFGQKVLRGNNVNCYTDEDYAE